MITAIIIDDEQDAIESLTWEINMFCKDIKIVDSFTNPEEAISAVNLKHTYHAPLFHM